MAQIFIYPPDQVTVSTGSLATGAKQDQQTALLTTIDASDSSINTKTPTLGQKTMAGSSPVVIASDQSAVPISGSISFSSPQHVIVDSSALPSGAATSANQSTEIASLASIDSKLTSPLAVTGPLTDTQLRASAVPVSAASLPLPAGAATSANQSTQIASLASIDSKLTSPLAVTAASLPLPSGAATEATLSSFSAKTAAALVPNAFDYQAITYVGVTTDIDTVVYKLGGAGGTTVATLTMGYDGSNRLSTITKT